MRIKFEITGAKEMEAALKQLGVAVANKLGMSAVEAGARVIAKEAKRLAPVHTGRLVRQGLRKGEERAPGTFKKSIGFVPDNKGKPAGTRSVKIGAVTSKDGEAHGRLSHLLEFGHTIVRGGKVVGHAAPHPFLRPARDTKQAEAQKRMGENLAKGIEREVAKLATKTKK
jgi:HK97 gp10 family phage protein